MQRIMTDPHSPGACRANGTLSNMPEFAQAFSCKPGTPTLRSNARHCFIPGKPSQSSIRFT
jgi:predicted metalloendopeptidase